MDIPAFLTSLKALQLTLVAENGYLFLRGSADTLTDEEIRSIEENEEIIDYIRTYKNDLIEYISNTPTEVNTERSDNVSSMYRLSGLQQGMLFHGLYNVKTGAYIEQLSCDLSGLDISLFGKSWEILLERHSILRSGFYYDVFNIPVQCVYKEVSLPLSIHDYRSKDKATIAAYEVAERERGFDFSKAPLMRIGLLQLEEDRYRMVWTSHHILFDGWSMQIVMEELLITYEALVNGTSILSQGEDRYEDYIRYLENRDQETASSFWRNYLSGLTSATLLPFINSSRERTKGVGDYGKELLTLDQALTAQLIRYSRRHHITVNTLMQGVWSYLLHQYTGNRNVVYGVTVSGRPEEMEGIEKRVGLYINALPLHSVYRQEDKIADWLQALQMDQISAREYQYNSLSEIQGWTGLTGDLFDTLLVFENYPISDLVATRKWQLRVSDIHVHEQTNYPLSLMIIAEEETQIYFTYNLSILDTAYVKTIAGHFAHVVEQIVDKDESRLQDITLLTEEERQQLLQTFNGAVVPYPVEKTVLDLFREQVALTPDEIALIYKDIQLNYRELDERSNQLAHYLQQKGIGPEVLVPVCIERCAEMLIGILAILKAGGAYVPMDPAYPEDRLRYMLEDTRASLVLSNRNCRHVLPVTCEILSLDEDSLLFSSGSAAPLIQQVLPAQLAYIIYTSGSTGTPKGVMIEHASLLNYLLNSRSLYMPAASTSAGSWVHLPFTFDAAVTGLFTPLITGLPVVISAAPSSLETFEEPAFAANADYAFIKLTPAHTGLLEKAISRLSGRTLSGRLVIGGEALQPQHIQPLAECGADVIIFNEYGPTEATVGSTVYTLDTRSFDMQQENSIPIGKPMDNVRIYITDAQQRLLPVGVPGEICIGGVQVARGYLHREELTAQRFLSDPFQENIIARLYRTGDLGRWLPDGNIEYLGRLDDQVKIRGYRIEPAEIEQAIVQSGYAKQAVVVARASAQGHQQLLAYVVPVDIFDKEQLLAYLRSQLPEYMLPAILIPLADLPLTANGKVDRKALPSPEHIEQPTESYTAPVTDTEILLAEIWAELLGVEQVGIHDNFFELGGDSIIAIQLVSRARRGGCPLEVGDVFEHPTISKLSSLQAGRSGDKEVPAVAAPVTVADYGLGNEISPEELDRFLDEVSNGVRRRDNISGLYRLSGLQQGMLFHSLYNGNAHAYIEQLCCDLIDVDEMVFAGSWKAILDRHSILRSGFYYDVFNIPVQCVYEQVHLPLLCYDYRSQDMSAVSAYTLSDREQGFDFGSAPLMRISLLRLDTHRYRMIWTSHHILFDGWSMQILLEEFLTTYEILSSGGELSAQEEDRYEDYIRFLEGQDVSLAAAYWKSYLSGLEDGRLLPFVREGASRTKGEGHYVQEELELDATLTTALTSYSRRHHITVNTLMQGVWAYLLHSYTGKSDVVYGVTVSGRPEHLAGIEQRVGLYINSLPLRSQYTGMSDIEKWLQGLQSDQLNSRVYQYSGLNEIQGWAGLSGDLFDSILVFENYPLSEVAASRSWRLQVEAVEVHEQTNYPLSIIILPGKTATKLRFSYNSHLLAREYVKTIAGHFAHVLEQIVSGQVRQLSDITLLTAQEQTQLLREFNGPFVPYPLDRSIVELFREQATYNPGATAVTYEGAILNYRDLDIRSNQLAHYLRKQGVTQETLVPLCIERGLEMIIGILGVLKAGGAYVPLDPAYPQERLDHMLADTGAALVLSSRRSKHMLPANVCLFSLDEEVTTLSLEPEHPVEHTVHPNDLAYVIYTSGSTGVPKGVMIEHRGVVNLVCSQVSPLDLKVGTRMFQFASFSFDGSCYEIFCTLLNGGHLLLAPAEVLMEPAALRKLLSEQQAAVVALPPSYQSVLADGLDGLETVISAGEMLNVQLARKIQSNHIKLINTYGPTENTVSATLSLSPIDANGQVTIGKPLDNVKIYITDSTQRLLPVGVPGELCIGGVQVARGYLKRAALSAEKFLPDPYAEGGRLYRTGDLCRWLPDGTIEYLGRIDDQVKIRGYRIELGEIEHALYESGQVSQCVVLARALAQGHSQLVCYLVPAASYDKEALLSWLRSKLPEYMVPGVIQELSSLPLTPNGKVDRKQLLSLSLVEGTGNAYIAPATELETVLSGIWSALLGVSQVGTGDNFFELGGDSIITIQVVSRLRRLGYARQPRDIFQNQTIGGL
ncbi:non-ribosomal peptide synthetase [Chitinophaga sp. MD30]|uniref:non-ribosomal peptide synthetase n=1 Tax=Chitinophaga sp. MD30 TaxID=2033437 RepID=UPI000BB08B91|nr:non-ribosomal peptide synthetase [Chitinophaga sp. MD30]ASZ12156.1 hypothetical protein CK934_14900 [Chitinophaga sp. MD30]